MAQQNDVLLTARTRCHGRWVSEFPAQTHHHFLSLSDTQNILTQTPASFRPLDARDPAASQDPNCPTPRPVVMDGDSPSSDNCHPSFSAALVGVPGLAGSPHARPGGSCMGGGGQGRNAASRSSPRGRRAVQCHSLVRPGHAAVRIYSRGRSGEPTEATRSTREPFPTGEHANATRRGNAPPRAWRWDRHGCLDGPGNLLDQYQFTLSLPSYRNGKYLTGTSTNYNGGGNDTDASPDYVFEQSLIRF